MPPTLSSPAEPLTASLLSRLLCVALVATHCAAGHADPYAEFESEPASPRDSSMNSNGSNIENGSTSNDPNSAGSESDDPDAPGMGSNGENMDPPPMRSRFIRRDGRRLVLDGQEIELRGISFGNEVWTNTEVPFLHHTEEDFRRIHDWGMNVVRFYLNYSTLESDTSAFSYKDTGWDWIDENVAWAKAHDVYLVLNIHVPQGGFQPGPDGNALWDEAQNQERFVALWKAIAERYAEESVIAGYDLLNEPDVSSAKSQWVSLAQRTVDVIRTVDQNHLIIVERTNAVNQDYTTDANMNLFLVEDDNVMYTFHFYGPFTYTHQFADWVGLGDGGRYPDAATSEALDRGGERQPRTRAYLEAAIGQYVNFGIKHDVPLFLGEFGAIRHCFENDKGGEAYVRDVIGVAKDFGLSFAYHTYHEDNFGVFYGYGRPVDANDYNAPLQRVLASEIQ